MKRILFIFSLSGSLFLSACNQPLDKEKNASQNSTEALQVAESEIKVTVKEYREEAGSINAEAYEIIKRAAEIKCPEAKRFAEAVLEFSKKAEQNTNLLRVEQYIEDASQALGDAEDALIYCEESGEISYASGLEDNK